MKRIGATCLFILMLAVCITAALGETAWTCPNCGQTGNTDNFCTNCGTRRPGETWTCPNCGQTGNTDNFCPNCGTRRPDGTWTCPNCGKTGNTDNFCTNCGTKRPEGVSAVITPTPTPKVSTPTPKPKAASTPTPRPAFTAYVPPATDTTAYIRGADNRVLADRLQYPYSAIALIHSYKTCGCSTATNGFLIGPRTLLTSATTEVCSQHGGRSEHMDIWFGYDTDAQYAYLTSDYTAYPMTDFRGRDGNYYYSTENDYCFIELKEDVGYRFGWFGLTARTDGQLMNHTFRVAGYSDGQMKTTLGTLELMDGIIGRLDPIEGDSFRSTADMSAHWRGAPMFDANYNVMGVMVSANEIPYAWGNRVTETMLRNEHCRVNGWYEKYVSSMPSVTVPATELLGTGLIGRWKMVSTTKSQYANETLQNGSTGIELIFSNDGNFKTVQLMNGKAFFASSQAYVYQDNTLYTKTSGQYEPYKESEVVLRGDQLVFTTNSQIDTYQRIE